jgi:biopolymer transport protein ExbB
MNLSGILLQANTVSTDIHLWDILEKGGWLMIILAILSLISIFILIERTLTMHKATKNQDQFLSQVKEMVQNGDLEGAKTFCSQTDTPTARMIEKGLSRVGHSLKDIEVAVENVGKIEVNKLSKNLSAMATISGAAPMLGFLGTVTGMIKAFISIATQEGTVSPKDLAGGIYEAMITTAAGLAVGIVAYMAYNYLTAKLEKIIHNMEYSSVEFMDLLQEPHHK